MVVLYKLLMVFLLISVSYRVSSLKVNSALSKLAQVITKKSGTLGVKVVEFARINIPKILSSSTSSSTSVPSKATAKQIVIRHARKEDIKGIRAVNLMNLPENYEDEFYKHCLSTWPNLCLVASLTSLPPYVTPSSTHSSEDIESIISIADVQLQDEYENNNEDDTFSSEEDKIVAYCLGRVVSTSPSITPSFPTFPSLTSLSSSSSSSSTAPVLTGHVTSLAVNKPYRHMGIAVALMKALHKEMNRLYDIDKINLHVRPSNIAAVNLYKDVFAYKKEKILKRYYDDGEDAYLLSVDKESM